LLPRRSGTPPTTPAPCQGRGDRLVKAQIGEPECDVPLEVRLHILDRHAQVAAAECVEATTDESDVLLGRPRARMTAGLAPNARASRGSAQTSLRRAERQIGPCGSRRLLVRRTGADAGADRASAHALEKPKALLRRGCASPGIEGLEGVHWNAGGSRKPSGLSPKAVRISSAPAHELCERLDRTRTRTTEEWS
jgi:hypothetical protein